LPGGIKIGSMPNFTQQLPNIMDPFQSLLQGAQPALGAIQPAFDIIGFVMKLMQCQVMVAKVVGALMGLIAPGNPFSFMFNVDPMLDEDDNPITDPITGMEIPDFPGLAPAMLECIAGLMGSSLKLAGLIPQLSMGVSIKDLVLAAMGFVDAAMSQLNSLTDLFTELPQPTTGNSIFDALLQCAGDNAKIQLEHKIGPLGNLVPLMGVVSLLADVAKQPLPRVIYDLAKFLAEPPPDGFGIIPFPDLSMAPVNGPTPETQRADFLNLIDDLTITGLPIEIPDFSDLGNLGTLLQDMQAQVEPIIPAIELVQSIFNKLTER
jgi:hypothetical protein